MQQKAANIDDVIAALEHFRTRAGMYIYPVDVANTCSFLHGLELALGVFGVPWDRDVWWRVQADRGWEQRRRAGPADGREGNDRRQIIDELIDIEIETLRRSSAAA